jgi:holo-[acyl-carrier protein] synthase
VPLRVGIDLVCADEVRDLIEAHGRRYIERVYTEAEQNDCGADPARLASCFAAKEALMKALGCAGQQLPWRSVGVVEGAGGQAELELTGPAASLGRRLGLRRVWLSLTPRRSVGAAVVLVELQEER